MSQVDRARPSSRRAAALGLLAVAMLAACQAVPGVVPTPAGATPTPAGATPAPAQPTTSPAGPATPTPTAGGGPPGPTLVVEQQFCALEQGRDTIAPLLLHLQQSAESGDWESAREAALELQNWSASWRSLVADPVLSYAPTAEVARAINAALDILDLQLERVASFSPVMGAPPPSAEEVIAASTALLAAIELIDVAIAAVPELACGVGVV